MDVRKSGPFSYTKIRKRTIHILSSLKKGVTIYLSALKREGVNLARISILCHI